MSTNSTTMAPIPRSVNHGEESPLPSGQQIARWAVGSRQVAVFQASDNLSYSITEGSVVETGNISLALYNSPHLLKWAVLLIASFEQVLLSDGVKPCFLPTFFKLYERPSPASNVLLALFAQLRRTEWGKEVVQAKWGIREAYANDGNVTWLEVTDRETKEFLTDAPLYKKEMSEYCQHFKEVVTLDADGRVQAIAMRCVSALDRDVFLDENTWAVTLISARKHVGWGNFLPLGHGSVAWEGVEAGSYFLKWADITTAYENRQPGEARIRIENRTFPSTNWMRGPTCSRPKDLVNRMVEYLSRDITAGEGTAWSSNVRFNLLAPFSNMSKGFREVEDERRTLSALENCLSFAVSALRRAEMFLPEPGKAVFSIEPHLYVMNLRSNYVPVVENNSQIIFRHKNAEHSVNDDVDDQIKAYLCSRIFDATEARRTSNLPNEDDDG